MSTFDQESYLQKHILYRLRSVAWCVQLANGTRAWSEPRRLDVFIEGRRIISAPHYFLTNPATEIGIIYSRALLEFLGLKANGYKTRLVQMKPKDRQPDSKGIEQFMSPAGRLQMVTPSQAFSCYTGPATEAEKSLVTIIAHADKGVAHLTEGPLQDDQTYDLVVRGAEGVLALVTQFVYRRLQLPDPDYGIKKQPHPDSPTKTMYDA